MKVSDFIKQLEKHEPDEEVAAILWTKQDVQHNAEEMNKGFSERDCREILSKLDSSADASTGITWDTLRALVEQHKYDLLTQGEYTDELEGRSCPHCRCTQVDAQDGITTDGNEAYQTVVCTGCGEEWEDLYKLAGYSLKDTERGPCIPLEAGEHMTVQEAMDEGHTEGFCEMVNSLRGPEWMPLTKLSPPFRCTQYQYRGKA